jgi:hypothetical protein
VATIVCNLLAIKIQMVKNWNLIQVALKVLSKLPTQVHPTALFDCRLSASIQKTIQQTTIASPSSMVITWTLIPIPN